MIEKCSERTKINEIYCKDARSVENAKSTPPNTFERLKHLFRLTVGDTGRLWKGLFRLGSHCYCPGSAHRVPCATYGVLWVTFYYKLMGTDFCC